MHRSGRERQLALYFKNVQLGLKERKGNPQVSERREDLKAGIRSRRGQGVGWWGSKTWVQAATSRRHRGPCGRGGRTESPAQGWAHTRAALSGGKDGIKNSPAGLRLGDLVSPACARLRHWVGRVCMRNRTSPCSLPVGVKKKRNSKY